MSKPLSYEDQIALLGAIQNFRPEFEELDETPRSPHENPFWCADGSAGQQSPPPGSIQGFWERGKLPATRNRLRWNETFSESIRQIESESARRFWTKTFKGKTENETN